MGSYEGAFGPEKLPGSSKGRVRPPVIICAPVLLTRRPQILDPFQELPQLLDPHLPRFLPPLAEAYLDLLQDRRRTRGLSTRSQLLMPLPNAIARILYAFCKIRGEKVVVRFLNVETRYLEVLLYAIEASDRQPVAPDGQGEAVLWTWHERYVVLLWLSQLFFAPFDLSTISSGEADDADRPVVPGFEWPERVPGIALRVIPLGLKFLASPGKERDGAKALLIRLAMRKDMQEIGILKALVHWSLFTLQPRKEGPADTPYYYIGSLAFLAGVLRAAADTSIMDPFLAPIYSAIGAVAAEDDPTFQVIKGSALARKIMIKVIRCVVTLALRKPEPSEAESEIVESSIGYLLESLADNDTPVRLAASKALSIITLKLESDMALQVVEAILESLNKNVLWTKSRSSISGARMRDLTSVDPLEWHGLMLTLSHLLYRRSPPPESLSDIIHALIMGLEFEKRGVSGGSIGANVRDAACFGIWALARRYSTAELLQVPTKAVATLGPAITPKSVIQAIATELVVAACLDPAGNIRRGSSAALQELIGRHPDTVEEGIAIVQAVDYHAVALRSRAINEVSIRATQLSSQYGLALLDALLGWRGVGDMDSAARRVAATSFGSLTARIGLATADPGSRVAASVDLLVDKVRSLHTRQVEERHGLALSLAAVFDIIPSLAGRDGNEGEIKKLPLRGFHNQLLEILEDCRATAYRKPELVAEAVSRLVVSSYPVLMADLVHPEQLAGPEGHECLRPGSAITACEDARVVTMAVSVLDAATAGETSSLEKLMPVLLELVNTWLNNNDAQVMEASSQAALILLLFTPPRERASIIVGWADKIRSSSASRNKHGNGFFQALTRSYHIALSCPGAVEVIDQITRALVERWSSDGDIDTHVAILRSLAGRDLVWDRIHTFLPIVVEGLDDYTTNARGDVGSHVRLEAIKATKTLWARLEMRKTASGGTDSRTITELYPRMMRLAAEKLDRVRVEAQLAVSMLLPSRYMLSPFVALKAEPANPRQFRRNIPQPVILVPRLLYIPLLPMSAREPRPVGRRRFDPERERKSPCPPGRALHIGGYGQRRPGRHQSCGRGRILRWAARLPRPSWHGAGAEPEALPGPGSGPRAHTGADGLPVSHRVPPAMRRVESSPGVSSHPEGRLQNGQCP